MKPPPVAKEERQLHKDKQWGRDERLLPRVEEGGSAALKHAVADELKDPAGDMDPDGNLEHGVPEEEGV